jgi:hypothetical protein
VLAAAAWSAWTDEPRLPVEDPATKVGLDGGESEERHVKDELLHVSNLGAR